MILTPKEAERIIWDDHEDWEELPNTRCEEKGGRWTLFCDAVFLHKPTSEHYRFSWEAGATEMQYQSPYEYEDEVKPMKVHLVEKTIKVWDKV